MKAPAHSSTISLAPSDSVNFDKFTSGNQDKFMNTEYLDDKFGNN